MKGSKHLFLTILLLFAVYTLIPSCRAGFLSRFRDATPQHIRDTEFENACRKRAKLKVVERLVKKVSLPSLQRGLRFASDTERTDLMGLLLKYNQVFDPYYSSWLLIYAAEHRKIDSVKYLRSYPGVDFSFTDSNYHNALSIASKKGYADIVQVLSTVVYLKQALMRNVLDKTPLMLASENGHEGVVKILLKEFPFEKHVYARTYDGETALSLASNNKVAEMLRKPKLVENRIRAMELEDNIGPTVQYDLMKMPLTSPLKGGEPKPLRYD